MLTTCEEWRETSREEENHGAVFLKLLTERGVRRRDFTMKMKNGSDVGKSKPRFFTTASEEQFGEQEKPLRAQIKR